MSSLVRREFQIPTGLCPLPLGFAGENVELLELVTQAEAPNGELLELKEKLRRREGIKWDDNAVSRTNADGLRGAVVLRMLAR